MDKTLKFVPRLDLDHTTLNVELVKAISIYYNMFKFQVGWPIKVLSCTQLSYTHSHTHAHAYTRTHARTDGHEYSIIAVL